MNKQWLMWILMTSMVLLCALKTQELLSLTPFYKIHKTIKLAHFAEAKKGLTRDEIPLLELWESMLTGRSAPLSKWMKERYGSLGLNHLFTPSGFHLTAVLGPFLYFLKSLKHQLFLLGLLGSLLFLIPGQMALKRMVMIKSSQKFLGLKLGFIIAIITDCLFGSFQEGALSFSYSFLFLGIIYSGAQGLALAFWFFLGQIILAYFQGNLVSPFLLILSPFLNFVFALIMPALFLLSFPLWKWQLSIGIILLKMVQTLVDGSSYFIQFVPSLEVQTGTFILLYFFVLKKWKLLALALCLLSNSLNTDLSKVPSPATWEFRPKGEVVKIKTKELEDVIYFVDGTCKRKLIRGFWWEKCSPKRRSIKKNIKKLSYPS